MKLKRQAWSSSVGHPSIHVSIKKCANSFSFQTETWSSSAGHPSGKHTVLAALTKAHGRRNDHSSCLCLCLTWKGEPTAIISYFRIGSTWPS
jgi:hypothetical protein